MQSRCVISCTLTMYWCVSGTQPKHSTVHGRKSREHESDTVNCLQQRQLKLGSPAVVMHGAVLYHSLCRICVQLYRLFFCRNHCCIPGTSHQVYDISVRDIEYLRDVCTGV